VRNPRDCFHIAVPSHDLDAAEAFYRGQLGCPLARRYPDRVTFDFFGDQLVCHLSGTEPQGTGRLSLYPRHFGVTFSDAGDFEALLHLVELRKVPVFAEVGWRFEGMAEAHRTVVLRDPSDNLIEFKHYVDARMRY
jgi:uncharacterized protein